MKIEGISLLSFRMVIDYEGLVSWGWPYGQAHTMRLMEDTELRSSGERSKNTYKEWVVKNDRQFPEGFKLFPDIPSSPYLWYVDDVLDYFMKYRMISKRMIARLKKLGIFD